MTGPTRRDLEKRVAGLREDGDREGFLRIQIGGDSEWSGYYEWDSERGEYVNEHGRTWADAPESDLKCEIEYE